MALTMRRLWMIAVVLATGCLGGSPTRGTQQVSTPSTTPAADAVFGGTPGSCRPARSYAPDVRPSAGAPGTIATLAGSLPQFGENGQPGAPTTKLAVWWNLSHRRYFTVVADNPSPDRPGRVLDVATVRVPVPNPCTYRVAFRVPSVRPGSYRIVMLGFGGGGFASFRAVVFRVR
jgi:hypothetical protein